MIYPLLAHPFLTVLLACQLAAPPPPPTEDNNNDNGNYISQAPDSLYLGLSKKVRGNIGEFIRISPTTNGRSVAYFAKDNGIGVLPNSTGFKSLTDTYVIASRPGVYRMAMVTSRNDLFSDVVEFKVTIIDPQQQQQLPPQLPSEQISFDSLQQLQRQSRPSVSFDVGPSLQMRQMRTQTIAPLSSLPLSVPMATGGREMEYNINGDWYPSDAKIAAHLAQSHGINTIGMSRAQMLAIHDNAHKTRVLQSQIMPSYSYSYSCPISSCPGNFCPPLQQSTTMFRRYP
jgi:hypothetical protein